MPSSEEDRIAEMVEAEERRSANAAFRRQIAATSRASRTSTPAVPVRTEAQVAREAWKAAMTRPHVVDQEEPEGGIAKPPEPKADHVSMWKRALGTEPEAGAVAKDRNPKVDAFNMSFGKTTFGGP